MGELRDSLCGGCGVTTSDKGWGETLAERLLANNSTDRPPSVSVNQIPCIGECSEWNNGTKTSEEEISATQNSALRQTETVAMLL
jgi:hypothetical protein